ncbi:TMEM165/GDT1 family protein [Halobacterium zhouii]|uniref:TMEM165/GDT1 family protein n=1 Tax=Halobacterium zhouii TaxID=2902624 RepID=UPI001E659C50|nr:TMEM165/GDT1 family protein [Halobacterium zhouii]
MEAVPGALAVAYVVAVADAVGTAYGSYATPLATVVHSIAAGGVGGVIDRYDAFGPLLGSFLANTLATFGDKGQLVVLALASRYDVKKVFVGAMGAFVAWSALEVAFGAWVTSVLPAGVMALVTGGLFVGFALLTLREALQQLRVTQLPWPIGPRPTDTDGGHDVLSERVQRVVAGRGPVAASFLAIGVAEFGDKTQALTIALAAHFPESRLLVFVGVVAALGLRTGVDVYIGDHLENRLPTGAIELAAGIVFLAFGLAAFGVIGDFGLVAGIVLALAVAVVVAYATGR